MNQEVHYPIQIAKQAIFEADLTTIHAYELLSRPMNDPTQNSFAEFDSEAGTNTLIRKAFHSLGIQEVSGGHPVFINFSEKLLLDSFYKLLPRDMAVIEVLEDVMMSPQVYKSVIDLQKQGFKIALDDFIYQEELVELVKIADYIKVDILQHTPEGLIEQVELLKPYRAKLLAEKVESFEIIEDCLQLGFSYFQGYILGKPQVIESSYLA